MERPCEACGKAMIVQRSTKRFCSSSCRARSAEGKVVPLARPVTEATSAGASLEAAVRADLEAAGRTSTALGVSALLIAARLDSGKVPDAAVSGLNKELRATLVEATRGTVKSSVTAMRDELAERRRQA